MVVYIYSSVLIIIEVICFKIYFEAFGEKRSKNSWRNGGITLLPIVGVYTIALFLHDCFLTKQVLTIAILVLFMLLYIKIGVVKAVILSLLFEGVLLSVDYFVLWLVVTLFGSITKINEMHIVEGNLMTVLSKIILFTIVLWIRRKFKGKSVNVLRETDWLRFLFFPIFTIFVVVAMLITSGGVQNQKQESVFVIIALCLAGFNIVVFYLMDGIMKRELKIRESQIFQMEVRNQTDMYRSISENFAKQRKKTHEYKNQLMCIEALTAAGKYEELKKYVKKVSGNINEELDCIKTNHVIIDAILNSKYREMLDKNIVFIFKINDLSGINISDEDIVVILSNLLNNAIEACEKCPDKRVIKMKLVREKDNFIISVKNTYDGMLSIEDGKIRTSKEDEMEEHGIGIKNIVDVITKYQGSYVIRNDEHEFYFSIILPVKSDLR